MSYEYVSSTLTSSVQVDLPVAELVQENATLRSFKKEVCQACKQKFQQLGIPVAERRFKVHVPLGGTWAMLTQPIRVSGKSDKKRMSPVKQVLQENHVQPAAPSSSTSDIPAWFAAYQQETNGKFSEQNVSSRSKVNKSSSNARRSRA